MAVEQLSKYWPNLGSSIDAHSSPLGPLSAVLLLWWPGEPPHVHVERENSVAKIWLDPVRLERNIGFRALN